MPSTRSTSSSDGERKPNTRSKGGGTKASPLNTTKPSPRGRALTKPLSTHSVNRSKSSQVEQNSKHGGPKVNKVTELKDTPSKPDQGPVEKGKRGRKPKPKETDSPLKNDSEKEECIVSDSSQKVTTTNGSKSDQKSSSETSSNSNNFSTGSESNHSTNLLKGNETLEENSSKETSNDTKHISGNDTSNVSSNNNADSVSNSTLQKEDPALFEMISPEEIYLGVTVPTANELQLLEESCDDAKTNNVNSVPNDGNSILGADNPQKEISNCSDPVSKKNVSDNPSTAQDNLQAKLECSDISSQKRILEECDETTLSSKSQKSNLAVMSESNVRKSGRRSVPNRKYQDMETDFSRKKSKTAASPEKKSGKSPEQAKASKTPNSSASTLKRKLDLNTEKTPASKKRAVNEPSVNVIEKEKDESPKKSVQTPLKTTLLKRKVILTPSTLVSPVTSPLRNQLPSPLPTQKITSPILKIGSPILKITSTAKTPTPIPQKVVQSLSVSQPTKADDLVVNNLITNKQTEPTILFESESLAVTPTVLTASKHSDSVPNVSALSEEHSENLTLFQTANIPGDAAQRLSLPDNSKTTENFSKPLPAISDSLNSSPISVSTKKPEHIIMVHPAEAVRPQENQRTDFLVADKNIGKELSETSGSVAEPSRLMVTLPNTISPVVLQNSSSPNASSTVTSEGPMTYSVDLNMPSTKPIISFTEGISQTSSPYTVSLLNSNSSSSSKDKEAVESLINASHIAEKVNDSTSVMMCLTSGTEDLVPSAMTLDVNTHNDAHRLETEAAIQEITASFPPTFNGSDIVISEKDPITKSSISIAEAAKMVAESQTIVDLPDVSSISECDLEGLHSQPTPVTREATTTTLPTAESSTQTPLQVRRKSSKASSLLKSLTGNMQQQSGKLTLDMDDDDMDDDDDDDEDEDDDLDDFDNDEEEEEEEVKQPEPRKGTQEFIVVHLPEGAQIKRERVDNRHQMEALGRGRLDENGSYRCSDCNYVTAKKANWYKHRKKHLGLRPHCCLKCDYKATTSSNLKRHMAIHADLREYKCSLCSNYFRQKIHLERHMKYKHEEKKVQCPLCNYVCASENPDLKIHFKRRHIPSTYGTMGSFTCDECGLVTVSKKDLKQHAKFHRRGPELKLFCEQCSFVTDCESRLRRHVFTHTKVKPFKCGLCDYRGSQKEHVLRHMKSRHSIEIQRNPRRSREDECGLENLDRDRTDFTSRDKIFACNHCSMKFSKLINLYKHLHTQHKTIMPNGEQNEFYCVVCDFKTTSKKNLLVHMRKHNMQEQNPPSHVYSCVLCRYVNPKRRNLFQHMMKKHGIEIVMNMKDDNLSNGFSTTNNTPMLLDRGDGSEPNIMTVGNVVTATSDESNQLMVVTEDADSNTMQTVITIEDLASSMTNPVKMSEVSISSSGVPGEPSDKVLTDELNQQQHAADAVEGLQALAEHPRVVDHDNHFKSEDDVEVKLEEVRIDAEREVGIQDEVITEKSMSELDEATVSVIDQLTTEEEEQEGGAAPTKESFELTTDQVVHLSTGDYVEINGEVYKVEISTEPAEETVTTSGDSDPANPELFETVVQNETNATDASFLT